MTEERHERRLAAAFSFHQNDLYDTIVAELERLAEEETNNALSSRLPDGENREYNAGRAAALKMIVPHFEAIRESARRLKKE